MIEPKRKTDYGFKEAIERGIEYMNNLNREVGEMFEKGRPKMSTEIKPCPICQKSSSIDISYSEKTIKCMDCDIGCSIEVWNHRVMPSAVRDLINAANAVLTDDDSACSLAEQRKRWPERMSTLKTKITQVEQEMS